MARHSRDSSRRRIGAAVLILAAMAAFELHADEPNGPAENPLLRDIPLSSLPATLARPLFSPSRRPPAKATVAASAPPPAAPAAPVQDAPPAAPNFTLSGTAITTSDSFAIFAGPSPDQTFHLRKGEAHEGWTLSAIEPRSAVVTQGDQTVTLDFPKAPPPGDLNASNGDDATPPSDPPQQVVQPPAPFVSPPARAGAPPQGEPQPPIPRPERRR